MSEKEFVKLKEEELSKVTGGTDGFQEAEELELTPREKKELQKKKEKENGKYV